MSKSRRRSDCPIHFALEAFGDSWTLLIVRDLMFKGRTTYTEFLRAEEGIATNILADRLVRLERDGIIERDEERASGGYRLTAKGIDLLPIMLEVISWSAKHDPSTAAPRAFVRRVRADRGALEIEIRAGLRVHAKGSDAATTGPRAVNTARAAPLRGRRQPKEGST
ncbi:MAG: winged helix-turn-helix transcriptional regulator [Myxococcaceae bacterium]